MRPRLSSRSDVLQCARRTTNSALSWTADHRTASSIRHRQLPTTAGHARGSMPEGETFYSAQLALRSAFYQIGLPKCWRKYSCLPRLKAADIGLGFCDGRSLKRNEFVVPRMSVMPMGWSHASHWCQLLHARIISTALPEIPLSSDDMPTTPSDHNICIASVYVDNFGVEGINGDMVGDAYWRAHRAILEKGSPYMMRWS